MLLDLRCDDDGVVVSALRKQNGEVSRRRMLRHCAERVCGGGAAGRVEAMVVGKYGESGDCDELRNGA